MRFWLSGPLILNELTRPSKSIGPEDVRARLPSLRRYEYSQALKACAAKHGNPITDAEANYRIDKALALGELDAAGPVLRILGTRGKRLLKPSCIPRSNTACQSNVPKLSG
jgi:hypothetical protein